MRYVLFLLLSLTLLSSATVQGKPDRGLLSISAQTVEAPLEFLASDWTEGCEVGTKGAYMAADYIASIFKLYDIKPLGDIAMKRLSRERRMKGAEPESYRSYFQNFDLLTGPRKTENDLHLIITTDYSSIDKKLTEDTDYLLQGNPGTIEIEKQVQSQKNLLSDQD